MTARLAAIALAALAAGVQAQGPPQQDPPVGTKMELKGRAPVAKDVLKVKLPRPQEADLANGLHLMVLEDHRVPQISLQIVIPGAGGYYDSADRIGLAGFTAQMMREGTATRTSQQISQDLERMSAFMGVNASASGPNATLNGSALTENFDNLFDLAIDVLLNPAFPADEWDRLKKRTQAALIQQRAQPGFLSNEMYSRVVYGDHPAGRVSATPKTLEAITRDAMVQVHKTRFVPDHALIAFAGDITLADARKKVEAKLSGWKKAGVAKPAVTDPPAPGAPKVHLVARPNSVQTSLAVGGPSMSRLDADYEELTVANRVLGGTMGRLFRHLREEKGYTYGVGSGFSASRHRGDWQASTSVRTEVTDAALTDLLAEIAAMREKPVPANELEDSKRAIVASFALSLESPSQMLGYYVQSWQYGLPADYWDTYPARISAVTAEQAQAAAKKYWDPSRLQIVAVGDATKITEAMRKKGTLEIYDTEGKPIKSS
jgi:predicted Zn-dependent peptidase